MRVEREMVGDVLVLRPIEAEVINNSNREVFYDEVRTASSEHPRILLDLKNITHMNSSAIGTLVAVHRDVTEAGATLKFLQVNEKIRNLLVVTKLDTLFEIYEAEEDALASFH